jgi:hypothetical protein
MGRPNPAFKSPSDTIQLRVFEAHLGECDVERRRSVHLDHQAEELAAIVVGRCVPGSCDLDAFEHCGEVLEFGGEVVGFEFTIRA